METRIGRCFGRTIWVALFSVLVVVGLLVVATAQDTLTQEITTQIQAVAYDPNLAAGVVRDAVAKAPEKADVIVRAAVRAAPHLSATLPAAALVPARDRVAPIQLAAVEAAPSQARAVAIAAKVASQVVGRPDQDTEIVSAAIRETPEQSTTIVTAAATVCRLVVGCSPISPMPIVKAAVGVNQQATKGIVEATVSLFPGAAGDVIAIATQSALAPRTARKRAVPTQAETAAVKAEVAQPASSPDRASGQERAPAPVADRVVAPTQPELVQPVVVADNTPVPGATDVVAPPGPVPTEFPAPTSSGAGDGTGTGTGDDDDDDDDDGDGTGTGTGTVPEIPDVPPVFPASPFF